MTALLKKWGEGSVVWYQTGYKYRIRVLDTGVVLNHALVPQPLTLALYTQLPTQPHGLHL